MMDRQDNSVLPGEDFHIKATNINKSFGSKVVLKNVTINVPRGKNFVIVGGSGTGKSVLIRNIIGLMKPDSGEVFIDGVSVADANERTKLSLMSSVGFLFQNGALFDSLPIWKNIAFQLLYNMGYTKKKAFDVAVQKLEQVGLSQRVAKLKPSELSGGMQKRAALARAIAHDPKLIFLDEPTSGLDPVMSSVITELIDSCTKNLGATTVTITHDMRVARNLASEVCMLYKGEVIWQGSPSKLDTEDNKYLRQFVDGASHGPIDVLN